MWSFDLFSSEFLILSLSAPELCKMQAIAQSDIGFKAIVEYEKIVFLL